MNAPLCIAHRGASRQAPENTLLAFRRAIAEGADGIELDVRITRDGRPVVCHDPFGRVNWSQLRERRVGGEPIPLLEEALESIGRAAIVQVEIKRREALAAVLRAIRRTRSADQVILASFEHGTVAEAAAAAPNLLRMLIADPPKNAPARSALLLLRAMASVGAHGLSVNHRCLGSEEFVATLRHRAVRLWCWTVNDPPTMRRLAAWGVDGILTDDPSAMRRTLGAGADPLPKSRRIC